MRLSAGCAFSICSDESSSSMPPPTWNEASEMPKNSMMRRPASALTAMTQERADARRRGSCGAAAARLKPSVKWMKNGMHADRVDDREQRDERLQDVHGRRDAGASAVGGRTIVVGAGGAAAPRPASAGKVCRPAAGRLESITALRPGTAPKQQMLRFPIHFFRRFPYIRQSVYGSSAFA